MRILIATQFRGIVGGVEMHLQAILPRLIATGQQIGVLTEVGTSTPANSILAGCLEVPTWDATARPVADLVRELADWKPDVIYSHGLSNHDLESSLADQFPTVLFAHNYHGTCVSGTKCHARPGYEVCRRTLGLGCLAAYLPRRCGGRNPLTMLKLYRTQRSRNRVLNSYRAVLVVSRHMIAEYRRHGVREAQLHLIPYFAPNTSPDPSPPLPRPRTDSILFVGRITRLKGLEHLIATIPVAEAALGRRLTLVVAGDGPDREAIEAQVRRADVTAEFLGWTGIERRTAAMRGADVLAVPSVWPEPFGLVGLEAGCVGLPAVGYAVGGIPDWLVPGVTGESAAGDRPDPKALAGALVRALSDDVHRHRLAIGAWEMACRCTPQAHLNQLLPILQAASQA